ncbi:cytochrome P450 2B19-like [Rhinophrynus dorsalis]
MIKVDQLHTRRLHLPPGPCPLPLVGNLLQGSTVLYQSYSKLSKQYGPVFTVWLGSSPVVALCGYEVVKDALVNYSHAFSARGPLPISERLDQGYGIISTNGECWQQMRRFAITTLRNFGMGKRSMEQRVQEEAQHLLQAIECTGGKAFNPQVLLGRSVNNVINLVVFGRRWDYDDKKFLQLLNITNNLLNFIRAPLGVAYVAFHKIMQYLPGPHQKIFQDCEEIKSFIQEQVISHRNTLDLDSPRDYIDCYLIRSDKEVLAPPHLVVNSLNTVTAELGKDALMRQNQGTKNIKMDALSLQFGVDSKEESPPTSVIPPDRMLATTQTSITAQLGEEILAAQASAPVDKPIFVLQEKEIHGSEFSQENLVISVFNLFVAGTETTANTLQFCLLVMIKYPHIQDRIQKEIDTVIGPHRLPGVADRVKMPYTNAVVHEIQRFLDLVPMSLPHQVTQDTFFRGFTIPKGTTIFPILGSVLSDPNHWETPDEFNPGHFLNEKGEFCTRLAFIPFSAGKRICPGEGLARMEIFLFLIAVLQKFTFKAEAQPDTINLLTLRRAFRKNGLLYHLKAYPRTINMEKGEERQRENSERRRQNF